MSSQMLKIAKNRIGMHMQSWKHEYWGKNHDFLFHLTFTCHISKFCMSQHGGALLIEYRSSSLLEKSHFFSYEMAYRCLKRPPIAPPCMRKFAHPFAPPFLRPSMRPPMIAPSVASKMWVFHENHEYSSTFIAIRSFPPPMRPPHMT